MELRVTDLALVLRGPQDLTVRDGVLQTVVV
jgi:hypothetical protein